VDKVLPECGGLVVTLYSISSIQGGSVLAGEGCVCFDVTFEIVLFKPFVGEVLEGTLTSADAFGAHVSVGFFGDIFISPTSMQDPSEYDEKEGVWVWDYNGTRMEMEVGEKVRFKVTGVRFPALPKTAEELGGLTFESGAKIDGSFAPMLVLGDMNDDGLGLMSWWDDGDDNDDDDNDDDDDDNDETTAARVDAR
jgi:DNA-directed RNA polymerase subunit E'/Rpb7